MKVTTIGLDLAKNVFQVHGVDERGVAVLRKQLRRDQVLPFFTRLEPCLVGIEACGGAHYWAAKEIAFKLGLSPKTVDVHRARIMERLGIDDVAGLTLYWVRHGLVDPSRGD
jgi:transposase